MGADGAGYWSVQIEATDELHQNLPLWSETFSTKAPEYLGWHETFWAAIEPVAARVGRQVIWLFDRSFDDIEHMRTCEQMQLRVEPLAEAIRQLTDDGALRTEPRRRGLAQVRRFTWRRCAQATLGERQRLLS